MPLIVQPQEAQTFARQTEEVERRAVEAVLAAERALGREPVEMPRNNPGYDIQSTDQNGFVHYIEVKQERGAEIPPLAVPMSSDDCWPWNVVRALRC